MMHSMSHTRLASPRTNRSMIAARDRLRVPAAWLPVVVVVVTCQSGCTSALTTAYLRDSLWEGFEHAAEREPAQEETAAATPPDSAAATADVERDIAADRADAERRQAAIEEAIERLSRMGTLDAAAQATLVATLQATQQEDWPVVIEAFSATLAEVQPADGPETDASAVTEATTSPAPEAAPAPEPSTAIATEPAAVPAPVAEPPAVPVATTAVEPPAAAPEPPVEPAAPLAVRNACFASRVQAWGVVDRFPDDRLAAGREVIVYFELDGLTAGESPAGFTTCIDTALRLVSEDGRELHAWSFEPVTETCVARRRDYFARYVVRLPATAAGRCRVEIAVTDTRAGTTASAALPCTVD